VNDEKRKKYRKEYDKLHKESIREYNKRYYQQNKDKLRQQHKKWAENNPKKIEEYVHQKRVKERKKAFEKTQESEKHE